MEAIPKTRGLTAINITAGGEKTHTIIHDLVGNRTSDRHFHSVHDNTLLKQCDY